MFPPVRTSYISSQTHDNPTSQVTGIPKVVAEDTSLVIGNIHGDKKTLPVPQGTRLVISTTGLHYNRKYWIFQPDIWLYVMIFSNIINNNKFSSLLE